MANMANININTKRYEVRYALYYFLKNDYLKTAVYELKVFFNDLKERYLLNENETSLIIQDLIHKLNIFDNFIISAEQKITLISQYVNEMYYIKDISLLDEILLFISKDVNTYIIILHNQIATLRRQNEYLKLKIDSDSIKN
jgi:hypothetical protein